MESKKIAFICTEYGIEDTLPIYAGGLGVLAGDFVIEAGKMGLDFTAVGLFYNGTSPNPQTAGFTLYPLTLDIFGTTVNVWRKIYGSAKLFLLDAGEATRVLYGPDQVAMFKQQIILGFGAVKLLKTMNSIPDIWHLNEGHTALTVLALACEEKTAYPNSMLIDIIDLIKPKIVATKHTILSAAGLHLPWEEMSQYLEPIIKEYGITLDEFMPLATHKNNPAYFSTTQLLLSSAIRMNAVSMIHADYERGVHTNSKLFPITNGVSPDRWEAKGKTKEENKAILFDYLDKNFGLTLNPNVLTIIWARRLAMYKRPHLLFEDLGRLSKMVNETSHPVQIIVAGKANSADPEGQGVAGKIMEDSNLPDLKNKVVFVPEYNLALSKMLVAAADVWLNTPLTGQEACGTSGMKAGLNGSLMLSTADGWMAEPNWDNIGWILTEHGIVENLYNFIETLIAPLYYDNKTEWQNRMQKTREIVAKNYLSSRMVTDYYKKLYFP
ncbi:hypothetical protein A2872_02220 [Candidatus Gottesmanbacteria bacterium RIFCSPHIGHO2_01_FULL_42_12]|uniref:Starch synthase catalytic domain-containing protein n=1 Tax=Candidatus Gottesmanbacteria bacterium RIFCSPHIGHO2_01_FULL_42_12 TaxID=1798377 RepID=A0A1F5Z5P2_9BACT|nr:MAG: hypothetical protein A2872_02220 [Candidatus Gottesmanbacteria bacterium RIFCSPHIGHO2_01_FULL_42_12]